MATSDPKSICFALQSASETSSLSSATTLQANAPDHHEKAQVIEYNNFNKASYEVDISVRVKANVPQRQRPKDNNISARWVELGYQKVLRTLITEAGEPAVQFDDTTGFVKRLEEPNDAKLRSWKRALHLLGMWKFSQSGKAAPPIFNLNDDGIARVLEVLMTEFGRGTNSSFLDDTYSIYLWDGERAAICFKVIKKVAVMYGDPLCAANQIGRVFDAFRSFCVRQRWRMAVVGAGPTLAAYARSQCWRTMEFAVEQVLNPMTNSVLDETSGKTITRTNRRLVSNGIKLYLYDPRHGTQVKLEQGLMGVYDAWREERRKRKAPQAYSAVINPFALPNVTRYLYTTGIGDKPNSLAGLIKLGANSGYLLEPCIQLPGSPKGLTGFLVTHAMGLLRDEGTTYMTFGLEALPELSDITLMPSLVKNISCRIYRTIFDALGLLGRKVFHDSFHPENDQRIPLYLLFPPGLPRVSVYRAVLDATHISPQEVWNRSQAARSVRRKQDRAARKGPSGASNRSGQQDGNASFRSPP